MICLNDQLSRRIFYRRRKRFRSAEAAVSGFPEYRFWHSRNPHHDAVL